MGGPKLLRAFLKRNSITQAGAADALGVSPSTLLYWLRGSKPGEEHRLAIARYTNDEVPAGAWVNADARARAERVKPFQGTGTEG